MNYVGRELREEHRWECPWDGCGEKNNVTGSSFDAFLELVAHTFAEHDKDVPLNDENLKKCVHVIEGDIKETSGS